MVNKSLTDKIINYKFTFAWFCGNLKSNPNTKGNLSI